MKWTHPVPAMVVAGAMLGLTGCSTQPLEDSASTLAATRQPVEEPVLLKDIHTQPVEFPRLGWSPTMSLPLPAGGTLVALEDELTGLELWKTDGTEAGTTLVKDLISGLGSSSPQNLTAFQGAIYFTADSDVARETLWRTDGTTAGTVMIKSFFKENLDNQLLEALAATDGALYFDREGELWKTDGTEAGTVSLQHLLPAPVSDQSGLVALGSSVFLWTEGATQGRVLWRTDGTEAGTVSLLETSQGSSAGLVRVGQTIFFIAGQFSRELWKTDGTVAGTERVSVHDASLGDLTPVGQQLFFREANKLWRTDGTEPGTLQLTTSVPQGLKAVGNTLFFTAEDDMGRELWKSDGTVAGTARVKDLFPGTDSSHAIPLGVADGRLILAGAPGAGRIGVWVSDGTAAGTVMLTERPGALEPYYTGGYSAPVGSSLLFSLPQPEGGGGPVFRTDGTAMGTVQLSPTRTGTKGSQVTSLPLGATAGKVFFNAQEEGGPVLWVSAATPGGTVRLKGLSSNVLSAAHVGSTFFFSVNDGLIGWELWKSDGTVPGTQLVKDIRPGTEGSIPEELAEAGGVLYFVAEDGVSGRELWKSDGTEAGTVLVTDLVPGAEGSYPSSLEVVGGTLFFRAQDASFTGALWKTDGTAGGTVKVKDMASSELLAAGSTLFLVAEDGAGASGLWKSDGTADGTVLLRGGLDEAFGLSWANGKLYFLGRDEAHGYEPWVSDGTEAGTRMLKDIQPGSQPSFGVGFQALGDQVLFTARDDAHGFELWRTDGTEVGTVRVTDLRPGAASGVRFNISDDAFNVPFELLPLADRGLAVFAGQDEAGGVELWVTDGTSEGTFRYVDLVPGPESSVPMSFAALGGQLFFYAGDAASGREPRAVPLPVALDRTAPTVSCPSNVAVTTAEEQGTTVEYPAATASDEGGTPTLAYSQASGSLFAPGDTQVTVTATDSAGNTAQCTFTVSVTVKVEDPPPDPEEEEKEDGCGCSSSRAAGAGAVWGLLLLALASLRGGRRASRASEP